MEKKLGDIRAFAFDNMTIYTIREILINPEVSMWWRRKASPNICPHCKREIEIKTIHTFRRIEILGRINGFTIEDVNKGRIIAKDLADKKIKDEILVRDDIVLYGYTLDDRWFVLTPDKYDEVFNKSKKFERLVIKHGN